MRSVPNPNYITIYSQTDDKPTLTYFLGAF